jgi:hypothetical protein
MSRVSLLIGLLVCVVMASGCVQLRQLLSRKKDPVVKDSSAETFIGVIESVNPEQKFVLVRMDVRMVVAPGTKLESRSVNGGKARLVVTPERKMNFLSADIDEGSPAAGDGVFLPAGSVPPTPAQPTFPETTTMLPMPGEPASAQPMLRVPTSE